MASLAFVGLEPMLTVTCFRVAFWAGQIASLSTSRNSAWQRFGNRIIKTKLKTGGSSAQNAYLI